MNKAKPIEKYLSRKEAAEYLTNARGILTTAQTLATWAYRDNSPKFKKLKGSGGRYWCAYYTKADLDTWLDDNLKG